MRKGARFLRFAALALLTGSLVGPSCGGTALAASPFNVNDPTDATDSNIGDGLCDISAMGPCTLRAAIQEANAAANCSTNPQQTMQTINVPPGTYNLDRTVQGIPFEGEDNSTIGDLDINTHVTINGAGASATIVDAKQNDRVLDIFGRPAAPMQPEIRCTVKIVGISITNGRITQAGSQGAGIKNLGKLTLDLVDVKNNEAGTTASLQGGGIYNDASLTLQNVNIAGNSATWWAGGIYNTGSLMVYDSSISNNQVVQLATGAGGILNTGGGTAELHNSTVNGNKAQRGGGIYVSSGFMALINSTISGNDALFEGGAIYASSYFRIVNSTVARNTSGSVCGSMGTAPCPSIYMNSGTATFRSTIIDQGATGCGRSSGTFTSEGFNIDSGNSCGLAMRLNLCPPAPAGGDRQNVVGPMLGPLASNGGFTQTHALLHRPGPLVLPNPAVDGVPANYAPSTDQRGTARPQFPPCTSPPCNYAPCGYFTDVGAYEVVQ